MKRLAMVAALLVLLIGCSKPAGRKLIPKQCLDVLENGEEFTLLSLDPQPWLNKTNRFHNWSILGKVQIKKKEERQAILNALYAGVSLDGPQAMCFQPRHGIHAKKGSKVEDVEICFECGQVYFNGVSQGQLSVNGTPAPTLNKVLTAAHIPISPYSVDSRPVTVSPPAAPAVKPIPADKWPHVPYVEIRAYLYNLDGDERTHIVNEKGELDRSVYDRQGVVLSQKQTEQLFEVMYQPGEPYGIAQCYKPRHAFVFYDAAHKPVARFEVCFSCNQYSARPRGVPRPVNLSALSQLVKNLGLPIFENDKDYEALKLRPKGGTRKKP